MSTASIRAKPAPPAPEVSLCSTCGKEPANGADRYCKGCRAAYMRQYRDQELAVATRRGQLDGFKRGAEAMRLGIVADFNANAAPGGMIKAGEVVRYILTMPLPIWEPAAETPA